MITPSGIQTNERENSSKYHTLKLITTRPKKRHPVELLNQIETQLFLSHHLDDPFVPLPGFLP